MIPMAIHTVQNVGRSPTLGLCSRPFLHLPSFVSPGVNVTELARALGAAHIRGRPLDSSRIVSVTGISSGALRTEGDLSPALYDALAVVQRAAMPDFPLSTCMNYGWAARPTTQSGWRQSWKRAASATAYRCTTWSCAPLARAPLGRRSRRPPPLDPRAAVEPRDGTRPRHVRGCVPAQASYLPKSPHISPQAAVGSDERGLLSGLDVVEVGCGRGGGAAFLFSRHAPSSLTGVDAAPQQIEQARRRFGAQGEALQFRVGAADSLPVEDGSADLLLSVESMHTYTDKAAFLREARRVLRPGGARRLLVRGVQLMGCASYS